MKKLHDILEGGHIDRYHLKGQHMLTRQNVAQHSWRMAAILFYVWPDASAQLIWATLLHDVSERATGDIPSPIKRNNEVLRAELNKITTAEEHRLGIRFSLFDEEERMLAWMDRFEGALHCCDELEMGNRKVIPTLHRYIAYSDHPNYTLNHPREALRRELQTALQSRAELLIDYRGNTL